MSHSQAFLSTFHLSSLRFIKNPKLQPVFALSAFALPTSARPIRRPSNAY